MPTEQKGTNTFWKQIKRRYMY